MDGLRKSHLLSPFASFKRDAAEPIGVRKKEGKKFHYPILLASLPCLYVNQLH
jgi:hypothetical protein